MKPLSWLVMLLAGCSLAPDYQRPTQQPPPRYQGQDGTWEPFGQAPLSTDWWKAWHDGQLDDLEQRGLQANQNLQAGLARLDQGRALGRLAWSNLWPSVDATASHTATQISSHTSVFPVRQYPSFRANQVGLDLNYEIDLWGALRNAAHAADAQTQASAADLEALLLSVEAEIALDYLGIRALDQELADTTQLVNNWNDNRTLTQTLLQGQEAALPDQAQADLSWQTARQQLNELRQQRQQLEHALALLVGAAPEGFQVVPRPTEMPPMLHPEASLPSQLLERRPDVVAAEARLRAANAYLGVARAAWFPSFNLAGNLGYGNTGYGSLLTAPNRVWSLGPGVTLPIFNGGQIAATNDLARAQWQESVALYRNTVLGAWRDVEDQLTALREGEAQVQAAQGAQDAAQTALQQAQLRFEAGLSTRFDLLQAQRTALQACNQTVILRLRALSSSVLLVKALGGGWTTQASHPGAGS